jgi:hypothetical protein
MTPRTVIDEELPNAASDVPAMAKGALLWLDGSKTLRSVGSDASISGAGIGYEEIGLVCRRMSVVEALSMAARMAHTVHVSCYRYFR